MPQNERQFLKQCYGPGLDAALAFVADAFRNRCRKGSAIPYLTHLLGVAALVGEFGGTEEQMIVALLHDVLEDLEGVTPSDLALRWGDRVAHQVLALSDTTTQPKPSWKERKEHYLGSLASEDPAVKLVSAADKLHNLRSLIRERRLVGETVWERFNAGREDQIWYFEAVLKALGTEWEHPILQDLFEAVHALQFETKEPLVEDDFK